MLNMNKLYIFSILLMDNINSIILQMFINQKYHPLNKIKIQNLWEYLHFTIDLFWFEQLIGPWERKFIDSRENNGLVAKRERKRRKLTTQHTNVQWVFEELHVSFHSVKKLTRWLDHQESRPHRITKFLDMNLIQV